MKIKYIEYGQEYDYKRIDTIKTITAYSTFKPAGTSLNYFKVDAYNYAVLADDQIISIEK